MTMFEICRRIARKSRVSGADVARVMAVLPEVLLEIVKESRKRNVRIDGLGMFRLEEERTNLIFEPAGSIMEKLQFREDAGP